MRTVRRESLKLNKAKFDALERIARAFASDKQTHLHFYQLDLNFSESHSYLNPPKNTPSIAEGLDGDDRHRRRFARD